MFAPQSTTNSTPRSKPARSYSPLRKTSVRGEAPTRGVVSERVDIEQPVRTLVLGLLKLGWTQHSNRFRSALDDFGSVASARLQHLFDHFNRLLYILIAHFLHRIALLALTHHHNP